MIIGLEKTANKVACSLTLPYFQWSVVEVIIRFIQWWILVHLWIKWLKSEKPDPLSKVTLEAKVLNQMKGSYLHWKKKNSIKWTEAVIWKNEAEHRKITGTNPCLDKIQGLILST